MKPKPKPKPHDPLDAWGAVDELSQFMSGTQLAVLILFTEAQRKRTRVKRSGIRVPLRGLPEPGHGPVKIIVVNRG